MATPRSRDNAASVRACRPWLGAEIDLVAPRLIVALGAVAAQALLGPSFRVTRQRGQVVQSLHGPLITATVHPSSILRAPDDQTRQAEMEAFVADLVHAAEHLAA